MPPLHRFRSTNENFPSRLTTATLGPLRLAECVTPPGESYRDEALARSVNRELCQIDLILDGHVTVEQNGNRAQLSPNDLVVINPARPVHVLSTATTNVTIISPRKLLRLSSGELDRISATRIRGDSGPGAVAASLMRNLVQASADFSPRQAERTVPILADLIAVALTEDDSASRSAADQLYARIIAHIDSHLMDSDLSPASIAAAHFISVRRLHQIFQKHPHTVAALIRERRLEQCRRDLADPANDALPVAAIGARWGLSPPAHFNRLFKTAYGYTPGQARLSR
uniref:helix-turn-helix domain-containing protein n=1 Tax=Paractinoplanes polyasparticus TaxID=2856853 RepID=UPI002106B496|nr:helix-turn-helix domain-containing protein [Actinoplanes polyasparticus]